VISFLQGVLAAKHPDRVEVDVQGVGYEIFVSQRTREALPAAGKTVLLKTYLHVREDLLQLFGFLKDAERQAFLLALSVSGVGPKSALALLSAHSPEGFYRAILQNDLGALKAVPGVGQKTAQHLVLELKEKVGKIAGEAPFPVEAGMDLGARNISEALQAMAVLGYTPEESRRSVLAAAQALGEKSTVEEIVKLSLKSIPLR
jgi:Holliday junction DNA helicase RuvA